MNGRSAGEANRSLVLESVGGPSDSDSSESELIDCVDDKLDC